MDQCDVVVRGADIVTPGDIRRADIAIGDGRILAIADNPTQWSGAQVIDASGLTVLPGMLDSHVHLRSPGGRHRETVATGTAAAAAGGVTTILEMPISSPGVWTAEVLNQRATHFAETALVDFGFFAGAGRDNLDQLMGLAMAGAVGFKTFLHAPSAGREEEFRGLWCADNGELFAAMRATAKVGLPHAVHCEDHAVESLLRAENETRGERSGPGHASSKPPVVEHVAVAIVIELARTTGTKAHIVHATSPRTVDLVLQARASGLPISVEVCPNHLFLDAEQLARHHGFAKCNPPLREPDVLGGLWLHLQSGHVTTVASDHAPFSVEEKSHGEHDIYATPPGIAAVELSLPLLLSAVSQGRLALSDIARLTAQQPADLFSLASKGRLAPGYDADLAIVDPRASWTFDPEASRSGAGATLRAYSGRKLTGRVLRTLVRGRTVFDRNRIVGPAGHGRMVRPAPAPQVYGR